MPKIGIIARMDKSGLGQGQTLRLARLLQPNKVLLIDSTPFNQSKQHPEWYSDYEVTNVKGFPSDSQVRDFLKGLNKVISCELFYNMQFTSIARDMRVYTILIANPEFLDWYKATWAFIPEPNKVIVPSEWKMDEMKTRFGAEYIPTPIFEDEFADALETNLKRTGKRKYLFMNGKTAVNDRNGLESLYEALHHAKGDFTITIKSQSDIKKHPDPRLIYDFSEPEKQSELYKDFDALILPRRYGGQALSMNEALLSGLPVVMTNIDPNYRILPSKWLVSARNKGQFMTRTMIDMYSAVPEKLAHTLDNLDTTRTSKEQAYYLGEQFEAENLRDKYMELIK